MLETGALTQPRPYRGKSWNLVALATRQKPLASQKPKEPKIPGQVAVEAAPGPYISATNPSQCPRLSSLWLLHTELGSGRQGRAGRAARVTSGHQAFQDREGQNQPGARGLEPCKFQQVDAQALHLETALPSCFLHLKAKSGCWKQSHWQ